MKIATDDRGDILHFAGFHDLSPALRDGRPAFTSGHDPAAVRCGWEAFFDAMRARRLWLVYDPADAASAEFLPAARSKGLRRGHGSLRSALDHAARFLRALASPRAAGGAEPRGSP